MSATLTRTMAAGQQQQQSLLDRLIDSQLDWRQLVREANGGGRDFQLGLARLSELQIKRQEVIHELVQTERHHCLTLALMRQVYLAGLRRLNESRAAAHPRNQPAPHMSSQDSHSLRSISSDFVSFGSASSQLTTTTTTNPQPGNSCDLIDLDRLFPALEDLIAAHELFFAHLKLRLLDSCTPDPRPDRPFLGFVGPLGALLLDQFRLRPAPADASSGAAGSASVAGGGGQTEPTNGQKLLQAYGKFCGSHFDSSKYYKQLMQADKGFRQFIESCNKQNAACRQRGIPECNLLVTQRLTKYPLLLEQLIKTSKDEPLEEQEKLAGALRECKCLLAELNQQLARKESFERLLDIYAHFCPKSFTTHNRHLKFTKHDLLQHKRLRQLIHSDGQVRIWSATRRKLFQVLCLVLNDIIVFLRFEPSGQSANLASELGSAPTADASQMAAELCAAPVAPSGAPPANNQQQQPELQQHQTSSVSSSSSSFRYYFANIDNKSSVISLSKLLVREKAAHDTEPRVYLISSDPRQPEMYELAFVSKRHQAGFVEKLKNCIEQHNRRVASMDELEFVDHLADNIHHQSASFRFAAGPRLTALGRDNAPDEDDDELVELNLEDCECCAACSNPDEDADGNVTENEDEHVEDEDESDAERRPPQRAQVVAYAAAAALIEAARRGSPSRTNCRSTKSKSLRQKKQQEQQRRRDTIGGGRLEIYELDIEQDVLSSGPPCKAAATAAATAANPAPEASSLEGERPREKSSGPREFLDSPPENGIDSELMKLEDEDDDADENPADSGLSERAKDSLDEASTAPAPTDAPSAGKQKRTVRGANRRRRAQRPRNVSNQSSSSSEAAHRQAIELISVCKQLQNEVGGQENRRNDGDEDDDEFDSGRGHDCSSSSSSTSGSSSLSSPSQSRAATNKGAGLTGSPAAAADSPPARSLTPSAPDSAAGSPRAPAPTSSQQVSSATARSNPSSSSSSSSSSCSSSRNSSAVGGAAERLGAASKSAPPATESSADETPAALVKPVCVKSCCCGSFSKQRKLSNVSSVSSGSGGQLKLISRLKANFDSAQGRRLDESAGCESPAPPLSCRLARQVSSSASTKSCCRLVQRPPLQQQMLLLCHHQQQQQQQRRRAQAYGSSSHCNDDETLSKQMRQQMRRLSFVPEQKLEELRDLRIQLDKDKQEWQAKFNRMQEQLLDERRELDLAREQLKQDRQQVASEREQLYRKLDALKEKGILLSPSHKVIITAPEQVAAAAASAAGATCYVGPAAAQAHFSGQPSPPTAHLLRPSSVCLRSVNTTTNSIRIHHQPPQQQQQQQQQHLHQQLNAADMMSPPLTFATANQVSTTNLFIQGSSTSSRVPLHLSENAAPPGGAQPKQTTLSKVTTPLISVIGCNLFNGVERFTGSTPVNPKSASNNHHQQHHHLESRVI